MSLISRKITAFLKRVADLPPKPGGTMAVADLQEQFDSSPEELRVAINGIIDDIIAEYATKSELSGIVTGQIPDGSVTPEKLSFDPATQAELNAHTGATTGIHGATSAATANTLAFRDSNGRTQFADPTAAADVSTKGYTDAAANNARPYVTGTYTGDGAASRDIALSFTPSVVFVSAGIMTGSIDGIAGAMALNGQPARSGANNKLAIGTNKFTVYYNTTNNQRTNDPSTVYSYIAFKP